MNSGKKIKWIKCSKCGEEYSKLLNKICIDCIPKIEIDTQEEYKDKTFENFEQTVRSENAFLKAEEFVENDRGLYLWGLRGRGKTHLAYAAYKKINKKSESRFINAAELLLEIRNTFNLHSEDTEKDIIDKYSEAEYLFIDDLGAEKITDYSLQTIYLILERREKFNKNKIFITSEISLKDIAVNLNDRIASRIAGMCERVEIQGIDWRTKK